LAILKKQAQTQRTEYQGQHQFLSDLSSQLLTAIEEGKRATLNQEIISSLWFKTLKYREDDVENAYDDTIGWLFDPDKTPFRKWLESGEGIFWISGLAGSGKSTLMKFASHNQKTTELLSTWANTRELHIADFYFWNSGFDMQKSQRGLLQSLLVQIFRVQPDLVASVCPNHKTNEPWGLGELKAVFNELQDQSLSNFAYCFFVDGLDEYSGEEKEIIDVLQSLSMAPHIKICASSRPWTAFERAFTDPQRKLLVQDHTTEDMKVYVHGILVENIDFQNLAAKDPRCLTLVSEIAKRGNGVWLWVYLVVKDLTRDIEGNEHYDFLKKRLDAVPSKLEDYFEKIMTRIDDIYKEEMAQIFLLTIESVQPPPLLAFELLGAERRDPNFALDNAFPYISHHEVKTICKGWIPKVRNRCGDLLNVRFALDAKYFFRWRVEFLHRTVGDWLLENHLDALREGASTSFDPTTTMCRITFTHLKLVIEWILREHPEIRIWDFKRLPGKLVQNLISQFSYHARNLQEAGRGDAVFQYIEALEYTMSRLATLDLPPRSVWVPFGEDMRDPKPSFLGMALHLGLSQYVQYVLSKDPRLLKKKGWPLLSYALMPRDLFDPRLRISLQTRASQPCVDMVKFLLQHGADPNELCPYSSRSVLYDFAQHHHPYDTPASTEGLRLPSPLLLSESVFPALILLVEHGGDLNRKFGYFGYSAREYLQEILSMHQMAQLDAIAANKRRKCGLFLYSELEPPWTCPDYWPHGSIACRINFIPPQI
jgi:hypothetical protein